MPNDNGVTTTETVKAKMEVVLNGGSSEMDSGIIPFRWFFNDTAIEKQPTHIFMVDQTPDEIERTKEHGRELGNRTVVKVAHGSGFIQFLKPGRHHLTFVAVKLQGKEWTKSEIKSFLERSVYIGYLHPLVNFFDDRVCLTEVDVDVPEALFAKKPESAVGQWFWNFVNRWHGAPARDECDFRRRIPVALICGFFYCLAKVCQYVLYAPLASLYLVLARLITFAVGYRPVPIFDSVGTIWQWEFAPGDTEWGLREWGKCSYSVWVPAHEAADRKTHWMPITGSELLGWAFVVWGAGIVTAFGKLFDSEWHLATPAVWYITLVKCLLAVFLLTVMNERVREHEWYKALRLWLGLRIALFKAWKTGRSARRATDKAVQTIDRAVARTKPPKSDIYFEWLRETSHVSKRTARVDIRELPEAFKAPVIHRFRVAAWALKRRFCKPYPH